MKIDPDHEDKHLQTSCVVSWLFYQHRQFLSFVNS